jgi:hypothetical protein
LTQLFAVSLLVVVALSIDRIVIIVVPFSEVAQLLLLPPPLLLLDAAQIDVPDMLEEPMESRRSLAALSPFLAL